MWYEDAAACIGAHPHCSAGHRDVFSEAKAWRCGAKACFSGDYSCSDRVRWSFALHVFVSVALRAFHNAGKTNPPQEKTLAADWTMCEKMFMLQPVVLLRGQLLP